MSVKIDRVLLSKEDRESPWSKELEAAALAALELSGRRLGIGLDAAPLLESIAPEKAFYDRIGQRPHNLVAVAIASENRVIINRRRFLASSSSQRRQVLVHEFTHLILGRRIPQGVPRWLNEGLAMIAAHEYPFAYHTRMAWAVSFGAVVPLDRLFGGPHGATDQELAYAESLSATRHLIQLETRNKGGDDADPSVLVLKLADPTRGRHLRKLLRNPQWLRAFERSWTGSIRTVWTWIATVTGSTVFWGAITWLFLFAYWRKRKRAREIEDAWREEEEAFPYLE